ncbi:MAG: hypothetical protein AAF539_09445 [Planctomycetota bacterium]
MPSRTNRLTSVEETTNDALPEPKAVAVYASDRVKTSDGRVIAADENTDPKTNPLMPVQVGLPLDQRAGEVMRLAELAFSKTGSWVVFYRWLLAPGGAVDQLYPTIDERQYFEATEQFGEVLEILASIRSQDASKSNLHEPERVITVRMPRSMNEATVRDAKDLGLSINSYCLTKLLQPINKRTTPIESGNRRGRKPGPQIISGKIKTKSRKRKK